MAYEQILPIQNRGPVVDAVTPARTMAVAGPTTFNFRMPMAAADIADTRNHVTFTFQISDDGGANFRTWIGPVQWDGGPENVDRQGNPAPPNASGQLAAVGDWRVRILYGITRRVGIGLEWEVIAG